ncbi:hypothetical protein ACH5AO_25100 [Streptomyces sp. NPDC018964]|uniref:hypothetical protein n=1 Tax=unclassified Streptomyces TaxID=2593676 RepID=UPI003790F2DE
MVAVTHKTRNIEITAENLQEELHRLEAQRQALERELAAVTAHLGSVQQALAALQGLMETALPATSRPAASGPVVDAPVAEPAGSAEPASPAAAPAVADDRTGAHEGAPERVRPVRRGSERTAQEQGKYGRLTEQIMEFFAGTGGTAVRARDVAAALGRDTDAGSINAVRSTLDRLVGTSRIQRAGRGLYRAHSS